MVESTSASVTIAIWLTTKINPDLNKAITLAAGLQTKDGW